MRFDSEVHSHNKAGGYAEWNSSSVSSSSTDKFGFSSFPVEREPYIPKFVDVNYIEGSNDNKWRDSPFPWTKELEVLTYIIEYFLYVLPVSSELLTDCRQLSG